MRTEEEKKAIKAGGQDQIEYYQRKLAGYKGNDLRSRSARNKLNQLIVGVQHVLHQEDLDGIDSASIVRPQGSRGWLHGTKERNRGNRLT